MKVTKKDILKIKAGSSVIFPMDSYENMVSIRSYVYQLSHSSFKPDGVLKYKTSYDIERMTLTVEALKS